jgi:hypothetical protein
MKTSFPDSGKVKNAKLKKKNSAVKKSARKLRRPVNNETAHHLPAVGYEGYADSSIRCGEFL